jgi:hypothetical protein
MKTNTIAIILVFIPLFSISQSENLVKNGDFDERESPFKFYAEIGAQRDFYQNGYKYSDEIFDDIYPYIRREIGYNCKMGIGLGVGFTTTYSLFENMDINVKLGFYSSNFHYNQNSIDTLNKYYPNVITLPEEHYMKKDNFTNGFYISLGPQFNIWRFKLFPSLDFYFSELDVWHLKKFNNEELTLYKYAFIPRNRIPLGLDFEIGYEYKMFGKYFIITAGFLSNISLSLKMEI